MAQETFLGKPIKYVDNPSGEKPVAVFGTYTYPTMRELEDLLAAKFAKTVERDEEELHLRMMRAWEAEKNG